MKTLLITIVCCVLGACVSAGARCAGRGVTVNGPAIVMPSEPVR